MKRIFILSMILLGVLISENVNALEIGKFHGQNVISIDSQTGMDIFIKWDFKEINNTHWLASFIIPPFMAIKNYPLVALTKDMVLSKNSIDQTKENSFYIIFPNGFKLNEQAKFGLDSTIISTSTTTPFFSNQRAICRDGNDKIHTTWLYNASAIMYANSTDGITWTTKYINDTTYAKTTPHISCDGNNITIAYEQSGLDDINVYISTDNGGSFILTTPVTSGVYGVVGGIVIERRGNRIYLIFQTGNTAGSSIKFINSTDGGSTWGSQTTLFLGSYLPPYVWDNFIKPSIIVNGIGDINDRIFITTEYNGRDVEYSYGISIAYSLNSGVSWTQKSVFSSSISSINSHSLGYDDSPEQLFISFGFINDVYAYNSSNLGVSWTSVVILNTNGSIKNPSVALDINNENCVFAQADNTTANRDNIVYVNRNNSIWNTTYTNVTTDFLRNQYPNTRWNYNTKGVDFLYINGTASPYSITYDIKNCTYVIPPTDTCTYSSGSWFINCNDNCTLSTTNTVNGNMHIYGLNGYVNFQSNQYANAFYFNATNNCYWYYNNYRWIY